MKASLFADALVIVSVRFARARNVRVSPKPIRQRS